MRMRSRLLMSVGLAVAVAVVALAEVSIAGQAPERAGRAAQSSAAARTPDGHPDFQGMYNVATLTPVERPESAQRLSERSVLGCNNARCQVVPIGRRRP